MRTYLLQTRWLLASGLLTAMACQSHSAPEQAAPVAVAAPIAADSVAPPSAPTLAHRFGPLLRGAWLSSAYLTALQQSHSPEKAAQKISEAMPVALFIATPPSAADSADAMLVYNMHEGIEATLWFEAGRQKAAFPLTVSGAAEYLELSYQPKDHDTTLVLLRCEGPRILQRTTYYRATGPRTATRLATDLSPSLDYAINQLTVAGRYEGQDSLGQPVRVRFEPNGRVRGLASFRTYEVQKDFIGPSAGDELFFNVMGKDRQDLAAQFLPDRVLLYSIVSKLETYGDPAAPDSAFVPARGKLRYTLLRRPG